MSTPLPIAKSNASQPPRMLDLLSALVNRHGCITGATGTGKTVTLQVIAEALSGIGVPVFMADVKGDLSGMAKAGSASEKMSRRLDALGVDAPAWAACPVTFWDVFGEAGHPVRATISDLGPLLLLDTKDLRSMLQYVGDNAADFRTTYGNISAASIGAIQRALVALEQQGGDRFFGGPMLNIDELLQTDAQGRA